MSRHILVDDLFDLAALVAAANSANSANNSSSHSNNSNSHSYCRQQQQPRHLHKAAMNSMPMPVDFVEEPARYVLHADLPGFKKDDINISVENGVLSLDASKDETKMDDKANYFHRERAWGKVHRSFRLPTNASHANAAVGYTDGVLSITFPKVENPGATKLTIQ